MKILSQTLTFPFKQLSGALGITEELVNAIGGVQTPKKSEQAKSPLSSPEIVQEVIDDLVDISAKTNPDVASISPEDPEPTPDPSRCSKLIRDSSNARFHHYLVGMDGSDASLVAFKTALSLRKAKGKFYALHVEDKSKGYLPPKMKWEGIKAAIESTLVGR